MQLDTQQKNKIINFTKKRTEIIAAYLFGSRATGKAGPLSDIDLAVLVDPARHDVNRYRYGYQAFLITELMRILGTTELDVVVLNESPPLLKFQVINHGEVIYYRSRSEMLDFHVRAFNEYQDFKPMLAVQHRYMMQRLAGGTKHTIQK